jgi:beta-1,4-N-acetylglucosaminyltransferase
MDTLKPIQPEDKVVFVTVGTTSFPQLVKAVLKPAFVAALVDLHYTRLIVQCGQQRPIPHIQTSYYPEDTHSVLIECFGLAPSIAPLMQRADVIVCHGGAGSIFEALALGKRVIAVPNEALMHNHQAELVGELARNAYLVDGTCSTLVDALQRLQVAELVPMPDPQPSNLWDAIDTMIRS